MLYRIKRFLRLMQKYHVLLLLVYPVMKRLCVLVQSLSWTAYKQDYSFLYVSFGENLTFVGQMALFLWLAFMAKYLIRTLREFLASKYPIFAEEEIVQQAPRRKGAVKQLSPRELINTVYYVLDGASILIFVYLCYSYIRLTLKSSNPVSYVKVFAKMAIYPYTIWHVLLALGIALVALLLLFLLRKYKNSFMCICQGLLLYGLFIALTAALVLVAGFDITKYALWCTLFTTFFLIASLGYGVACQILRFGNMNFATLHPLLPYEPLRRHAYWKAAAKPSAGEEEAKPVPAKDASAETTPVEQAAPIEQAVPAEQAMPAESVMPDAIASAEKAEKVEKVEKTGKAGQPAKAAREKPAPQAEKAAKPVKKEKGFKKAVRSAGKKGAQTFEERTGLSFKSLWTIRFTLQMIPYLILFVAFVLWISTSMYTIQPNEQALVYRLGRLQEESVTNPGLHFKFPAPIDNVEISDVSRMRSMYVGYIPAESNDYLWTSEHGGEEYTLLLGNGNELIAVNMRLNYYIDNLMDYRTRYGDPEAMLNSRAYAVMMERTVNSDLNTVLSVDRGDLASDVREALNAYSKEQRLGIHVAEAIIENIHPPVEVAEVYQNVVNASIKRATLTSAAESYAAQTLSAAQQQSTSDIAAATKAQTEQLAQANSESAVFTAACEAYEQSPNSYTLWKLTNAYQQLISGTRLYVFSPRTARFMDRFLMLNGQNAAMIVQ